MVDGHACGIGAHLSFESTWYATVPLYFVLEAFVATKDEKLSLNALIAMVVGSMVGAGIFNLPGRFGAATGPFGAIIAWAIAGTGMYMLARVFQTLASKRPDIDSGVFAYAKAGFGDYMGVPLGLRLLARQLPRQRLLLGADRLDAGTVLPRDIR